MKLPENERMEPQRQASAGNVLADGARHAHPSVLFADGLTLAEARPKLNCNDSHISRWGKRFAAERPPVSQ